MEAKEKIFTMHELAVKLKDLHPLPLHLEDEPAAGRRLWQNVVDSWRCWPLLCKDEPKHSVISSLISILFMFVLIKLFQTSSSSVVGAAAASFLRTFQVLSPRKSLDTFYCYIPNSHSWLCDLCSETYGSLWFNDRPGELQVAVPCRWSRDSVSCFYWLENQFILFYQKDFSVCGWCWVTWVLTGRWGPAGPTGEGAEHVSGQKVR